MYTSFVNQNTRTTRPSIIWLHVCVSINILWADTSKKTLYLRVSAFFWICSSSVFHSKPHSSSKCTERGTSKNLWINQAIGWFSDKYVVNCMVAISISFSLKPSIGRIEEYRKSVRCPAVTQSVVQAFLAVHKRITILRNLIQYST